MSDKTELLPCPFCGGPAYYTFADPGAPYDGGYPMVICENSEKEGNLCLSDCYHSEPKCRTSDEPAAKARAIATWNHRPDPALRVALEEIESDLQTIHAITHHLGVSDNDRKIAEMAHRSIIRLIAIKAALSASPTVESEAQKDGERLDWLEANYEQIERMGGKWWSVNIEEWSPTLRAAIDAAMAQDAARSRGEGKSGAPVGALRPPANHDAPSTSSPQPTTKPTTTEDASESEDA